MYRILVTDDEKGIRDSVSDYLKSEGMSVATASNGQEAVEMVGNEAFDLIILDVLMPVMNGLEACKLIREKSNVPILFLSAYGEEKDFLNAYKSGCDDYIVKPFPLSVLFEKCLAIIKRYKGEKDSSKITVGKITVDTDARKVFTPTDAVSLSHIDYELLLYLCNNKNIVLNRELILTRIWGYDFEGDSRVVDTHIKRIRKALGEYSTQIKTVNGVGYSIREV